MALYVFLIEVWLEFDQPKFCTEILSSWMGLGDETSK